jgi:predicted small metal-binding protein
MSTSIKTVRCECGYEARAVCLEQLVLELQRHARDAHGIDFAHEQALLIVRRSEQAHSADRPERPS